jgi:uroporphyrinogen III methyltransferase/synthase
VLIVRALVARDALPKLLREAGAEVDVVAAYETRPAPAVYADRWGADPTPRSLVELVETRAVDTVLFTSSSTVTATFERLGGSPDALSLLEKLTVASIGPITTRTAEELGIRVDVTATTFTVDGLLDALERHLAARASSRPLG